MYGNPKLWTQVRETLQSCSRNATNNERYLTWLTNYIDRYYNSQKKKKKENLKRTQVRTMKFTNKCSFVCCNVSIIKSSNNNMSQIKKKIGEGWVTKQTNKKYEEKKDKTRGEEIRGKTIIPKPMEIYILLPLNNNEQRHFFT